MLRSILTRSGIHGMGRLAAARLRAFHKIRTPDSIQMATAIIGKASFFLTNDIRLPSLPNLKTLVLNDLKLESREKEL